MIARHRTRLALFGSFKEEPIDIMKRSFAAYCVIVLATVLGGGSLLLFGAFLIFGPFTIIRMDFSEAQLLIWNGCLSMLFFIQHSGVFMRSEPLTPLAGSRSRSISSASNFDRRTSFFGGLISGSAIRSISACWFSSGQRPT